ncbi:uncharacterized protein IL334_001040 [Kwoniella shivajii]|uniref:BTB domain-containing protein n=1 Tax=Kwoniella shivajii TaxID=564305 RepID=A0ABZ1CR22_9TREE|nr:hypothetical protein IL334_001040 [Kwoniella shivajii]
MSTPPSSSSSRLPRPILHRSSPSTSSKYADSPSPSSKSRSRSKTTLAQPKVLPFPELSIRAQEAQRTSREGSRATSPMSTPPIDRLEVTFDQLITMSRGGSSEGYGNGAGHGIGVGIGIGNGGGSGRVSSGGSASTSSNATVSASASALGGSTSPPVPSPLAVSAARLSRARASTGPSRSRTSGIASDVGDEPSITATPSVTRPAQSPSATITNRTQGFRPASPSVSRMPTGVPSIRPTLNTPVTTSHHTQVTTASAPTTSIPSLITPATPSASNKHQSRPRSTHSVRSISTAAAVSSATTAITPLPTGQNIKDHLYQTLLEGVCADVRLIVKSWGVCYHAHKMILVQTNFFHTLFLGGFSENAPAIHRSGKGKERARDRILTDVCWDGEDVELTFDDPNITRAAFEICLSRLYSPYPLLHFPTDLLPTASFPLTPVFPHITSLPDYSSLRSSLPPKSFLGSPRLLLSLLATTIYLGFGPLMRETLALVLRTVGPITVRRYLSFAVGDGIGDEEYSEQNEEGMMSFSGVAKFIQERSDGSHVYRQPSDEDLVEEALHTIGYNSRSSNDSGTKISDSSEDLTRHGGIPIPSLRLPTRSNSVRSTAVREDPFSLTYADPQLLPHYYGVVGNKIGEACGCWLARWGVDILDIEMKTPLPAYRIWAYGGLPANLVRAILSSDYFFVQDEMERYRVARKILDLRRTGWDQGMEDGGDLSLAAGSAFGMEGTDEGWEEWEEEEREILKVFAEGIYYCHMTFNNLSTIASDLDPTTHLPYAPLSVLQAAHWAAADLRSRVTAHEKPGVTTDADDDDNELGLTQTTTAICSNTRRRRPVPRSRVPSPAKPTASATSWGLSSPSLPSADTLPSLHSAQHTIWHAVPTDDTHKIGASGLLSLSGSAQHSFIGEMPDFGPDLLDPVLPTTGEAEKIRPPPHGERTAFGLIGGKMTGKEIEEKWINEGGAFAMSNLNLGLGEATSNSTGKAQAHIKDERWTKIEPFRFSVEFFDIDKLTEKERFYSSTHFYAGSYFNCYVQMIKRKEKGVQLGVYLHRQPPNEPFPIPSSPRSSSSTSLSDSSLATFAPPSSTRHQSTIGNSPISHNRHLSTSPMVPGSPPASLALSSSAQSQATNETQAPYIDSRSVTKAFFSISCASALGTALIRFTSGPDCFALSQSWGWKSSALKSEEYLCVSPVHNQNQNQNQSQNHNQSTEQELNQDSKADLEQGVMGWTGEIPYSGKIGQCSLRATVVLGVV